MNKTLLSLKLYALSLIFSTGLYLAIAPSNWTWIADGQIVPSALLVRTFLQALSAIGMLSFIFTFCFAVIGIALDVSEGRSSRAKTSSAKTDSPRIDNVLNDRARIERRCGRVEVADALDAAAASIAKT